MAYRILFTDVYIVENIDLNLTNIPKDLHLEINITNLILKIDIIHEGPDQNLILKNTLARNVTRVLQVLVVITLQVLHLMTNLKILRRT